jgi:hypothetical protein
MPNFTLTENRISYALQKSERREKDNSFNGSIDEATDVIS